MNDTGYETLEPHRQSTPSPGSSASMRLRAEPPRVTRLSRKMLASAAAVALVGIGGALIYALQTRDPGKSDDELFSTDNRATADGFASLPQDYTGPVLGPPLPGDLGRPIVSAQHPSPPAGAPAMATPPVDPEEQQRLSELEAARTSRVFFQSGPVSASPSGGFNTSELGAGGQPGAQPPQDRQLAFLNGPVDRRTMSADRIVAPVSPYILQAGAVIPAALITGLRSDLPGQITAQVTENIYDSPTGRFLVVPQGTRIIGQYDNSVQFGQRRLLLVWNRLILPNGRSIVLERQPGADTQGYAGLEDGVDYHGWDLAKAAGLSTLLSIGAELAIDDQDRLLRAIRNGGQTAINDAGQQIIRRQLDVAPTLTIRPGFPVRIIVTRDLVLQPYGD